jgi:3-hydroxybutyryl-CoA dehydrogenase
LSPVSRLETVAVIGAGQDGAVLARVLLSKNYRVQVYDVFKDSLRMAGARLEWAFKDNAKVLENVDYLQDLEGLKGSDIVLQIGKLSEGKFGLFKDLSQIVSDACIISPDSTKDKLTDFAAEMNGPERFVGLNFIKPLAENVVVEIVKTKFTAENILDRAGEFVNNIDKIPIFVKDIAGGIVERIRRALILSAVGSMEKGRGLPFEIDDAVRELGGFAKGPFEMADEMGLEEALKIADFIYEGLGNPERLKPSGSENRLLQYGYAGRKTGLGFYIYDDGNIAGQNPVLKDIVNYLGISKTDKYTIFAGVLKSVWQEAKLLADEMEISPASVDDAVKLAFSWESGPFELAVKFKDLLEKGNKKNEWGKAV